MGWPPSGTMHGSYASNGSYGANGIRWRPMKMEIQNSWLATLGKPLKPENDVALFSPIDACGLRPRERRRLACVSLRPEWPQNAGRKRVPRLLGTPSECHFLPDLCQAPDAARMTARSRRAACAPGLVPLTNNAILFSGQVRMSEITEIVIGNHRARITRITRIARITPRFFFPMVADVNKVNLVLRAPSMVL